MRARIKTATRTTRSFQCAVISTAKLSVGVTQAVPDLHGPPSVLHSMKNLSDSGSGMAMAIELKEDMSADELSPKR